MQDAVTGEKASMKTILKKHLQRRDAKNSEFQPILSNEVQSFYFWRDIQHP